MFDNPLVRLQMSDPDIVNELRNNPDPRRAEQLMENKLRSIGLSEQEMRVTIMRDGLRYPLAKAMADTGLPKEELDAVYDGALAKINAAVGRP